MATKAKGAGEKKVGLTPDQAKEVVLGLGIREGQLDKLVASCISNDAEKAANAINAKLRMVKDLKGDIEEAFELTDEPEEDEDSEDGAEDDAEEAEDEDEE